jgi:hypothetical protein
MEPLFSQWVVLLAMQNGRAPLPVSRSLWNGLVKRGFPNDLEELGTFARRYLFLQDARMLLAELRTCPQVVASHFESRKQPDPELRQLNT